MWLSGSGFSFVGWFGSSSSSLLPSLSSFNLSLSRRCCARRLCVRGARSRLLRPSHSHPHPRKPRTSRCIGSESPTPIWLPHPPRMRERCVAWPLRIASHRIASRHEQQQQQTWRADCGRCLHSNRPRRSPTLCVACRH